MAKDSEQRESLLGNLLASVTQGSDHGKESRADRKLARELLVTLLSRAEKSKDDLLKVFFKELGWAIASILKEPLRQMAESKKVQITIELLPKKTLQKRTKTKKKASRSR